MAEIENLISPSELKWAYLFDRAKQTSGFFMRYDEDADIFLLLFVSPEQETVVYYVDDHVGLLIHPETMNVVGFQVEAFKYSFLPSHASVDRVWRLGEAGLAAKDYGDLILIFDQTTKHVAREVFRAVEDVLGEPAEELVAALA